MFRMYIFPYANMCILITLRERSIMNHLVNTFKLMSDETRLRIILLLAQEDLCVCELSGILEAPQPRISKNLSRLRDLSLVTDERREKFVFYRLTKTDEMLHFVVNHILNSISDYPTILNDQNRLKEKEKYVTQALEITQIY